MSNCVKPMTLTDFMTAQMEWSKRTFGDTPRTAGILAHMREELGEIEADPTDATEIADLIILALDFAWRHGITPDQMWDAMVAKQQVNFGRQWKVGGDDEKVKHI